MAFEQTELGVGENELIPDVLASDDLRRARRKLQECAAQIHRETRCNVMAFAAELDENLGSASTMAVDPELEMCPAKEVALIKGALLRCLSLLIMHVGREQALVAAMSAVSCGAGLLRQAEEQGDASLG